MSEVIVRERYLKNGKKVKYWRLGRRRLTKIIVYGDLEY